MSGTHEHFSMNKAFCLLGALTLGLAVIVPWNKKDDMFPPFSGPNNSNNRASKTAPPADSVVVDTAHVTPPPAANKAPQLKP